MKLRKVLLSIAAVASLGGGVALAQQPPAGQPPPGRPQGSPVQPRPLQQLPGGHPPVPGMPQRPGAPGGFGQPGSRGLPPGFNPRPRPAPAPVHHAEEEEHGGGGHHECPGHGPEDAPEHINWWHGIFSVNNERAEKGDFVNRLLFRYENPKDPCDEKNEAPPFLASLINFGVVAFVLYRFGRKPLAESLLKRKQTIMADIDTATKLKEDAEARLEEYEDRLENIQEKLTEVRAEYAAQAEQERKHLLAEAEDRRVRMRRDAEFRIEQELKAARAELLREAVVNAVGAAEELVAKQIASRDLDKMANDYLESIGPSLNQGARAAADAGVRS